MLHNKKFTILLSILTLGIILHLINFTFNSTTSATLYVNFDTTQTEKIEIELFDNKSPESVKNFIKYAKEGAYNNTIFHRIIPNFMAQGGGFDSTLAPIKTQKPIKNEATNKISNTYGTLAMARRTHPHSATSQFFINLANNKHLNHRNTTQKGYGYTVFGKVKNIETLKKLNDIKTKIVGNHQNVPINPITIEKIVIHKAQLLY